MQFEKKSLYAFVKVLTKDKLKDYINDICKLDCFTNSDFCDFIIGKRIMMMTSQKYGILKKEYKQINGLIMLAEGIVGK